MIAVRRLLQVYARLAGLGLIAAGGVVYAQDPGPAGHCIAV